MTLKELVDSVDKTDKEGYISLDALAFEVGINEFLKDDQDPRLKCCWTKANWICTDTRVGIRVYYLDGEIVCISSQIGRKYPEEFEWVSEKTFKNVRDFILSKIDLTEFCNKIVDWTQNVSSWVNHYLK